MIDQTFNMVTARDTIFIQIEVESKNGLVIKEKTPNYQYLTLRVQLNERTESRDRIQIF